MRIYALGVLLLLVLAKRRKAPLEMRHATCVCVKQQELSGFTFADSLRECAAAKLNINANHAHAFKSFHVHLFQPLTFFLQSRRQTRSEGFAKVIKKV